MNNMYYILSMQDITIIPIFNQAAPGVWTNFANICASAMLTNYNYRMGAAEISEMVVGDKKKWVRGTNFAFGAYDGTEMIGFIQGDARGRCATIQSLYVLKNYQQMHVGRSLLQQAERAISVFANRVELVSLVKAEAFYRSHGYSSQCGTNRHEKSNIRAPHCECVPVFKCHRALADKCCKINPNFDADVVNVAHRPMFAYFDVDSKLVGYSVGDYLGNKTDMHCSVPRIAPSVLGNRMARYWDCVSGYGR